MQADIYNINENIWKRTGSTSKSRVGSQLVVLGGRVFALGGGYDPTNVVEEFHHENGSWTIAPSLMIQRRQFFGSVAVPALLFKDIPGGCSGVH